MINEFWDDHSLSGSSDQKFSKQFSNDDQAHFSLLSNSSISAMFSSPTCILNDTSSTASSQFTYSQSSGSSWSQKQFIPISSQDSNSKYPTSLIIKSQHMYPSSMNDTSNTNSRDSSNQEFSQTLPSLSCCFPLISSKKTPKKCPELQRATVKLIELMTERASHLTSPDNCLIKFTMDDILPKLEIKQRRFYVITNVLASLGYVSHISQLNLMWRNSNHLVHRAIAQLYTEAQRYVKVNRLRSLLANQLNSPDGMNSSSDENSLIDIYSKTVIDVPGDNQGYLSFDDITHPRWIVDHKRKAHTAATQRLVMICMIADNTPVAFNMTRQCYDICRVLTATNILREVGPKSGCSSRRITYSFNGPHLSTLSAKYPSLKPVEIIQASISKRGLSAKSSSTCSSSDIKNSHQYKIYYSVVEPKDIVVDGEEIPQNKVAKILSNFGIGRSSVIVNASPNPPPGDCSTVTQNITKMLHCKIPNGSVMPSICSNTSQNGFSPSSEGNTPGGYSSSSNQKRKRKNSSDSGSNWRQLKLEELPIGPVTNEIAGDTCSPNWLSLSVADTLWEDLGTDLDFNTFLDPNDPPVIDSEFSDHTPRMPSPQPLEIINYSEKMKTSGCCTPIDSKENIPSIAETSGCCTPIDSKENIRGIGDSLVLRSLTNNSQSLRVLDPNVMNNTHHSALNNHCSSGRTILESLCGNSTSSAGTNFPMMTPVRGKAGPTTWQTTSRHAFHDRPLQTSNACPLSVKNVFMRAACDPIGD